MDIGKPCVFHIFLNLLRRVHFHARDHIFPVAVWISCITDHCKPPAGFQDAPDLLKVFFGVRPEINGLKSGCKIEHTVFQDLENKIFSGEERTDLTLVVQQANMAGALVGAGISWMVVGISIQTVCLIACIFCVLSYGYEIALGVWLKRAVAEELAEKAAAENS